MICGGTTYTSLRKKAHVLDFVLKFTTKDSTFYTNGHSQQSTILPEC